MPGDGRSCFFCCPPIRPPDYDPLKIQDKLIEIFEYNTKNLKQNLNAPFEIYGDNCWGLGFLDNKKTMVGCMLHPFVNNGTELRHLTGYGDKCRRERCLEEIKFSGLRQNVACFYLDLSKGLDPFYYSSRIFNPTFGMLMWGVELLNAIALHERQGMITIEKFKIKYSMFLNVLNHRIDAYLVDKIILFAGLKWFLIRPADDYIKLREKIISRIMPCNSQISKNHPYIHEHPVSMELSRFFKFGLNIWRESLDKVLELKAEAEKILKNSL